VLAGAPAGLTAARLERRLCPEGGEVAESRIRDQHDVAAAAAVPAVRATLRDVLLPPEAQASIAAAPGEDMDACVVCEHAGKLSNSLLLGRRAP
jgi:hypothetical protein